MNSRVNDLIESGNWHQFLESTAAALQTNLIFMISGAEDNISVCETCPVCNVALPPLSSAFKISALESSLKNLPYQEFISDESILSEVFQLQDNFLVIARDYGCHDIAVTLSFHDRVCIAKELLTNFFTVLVEQWDGGQLATELSALRQMNHIVLSMFRGENKALERALDLILSAVIILFDADGSFLEYNIDDQKQLLTKGNCEPSSYAANSITAEVDSPVIKGRLGINTPEDIERTTSFLHFMVQECIIAFEIDHLLKLMESRLTLVLGAIESMVLLVDRRMNICFANKSAEKLLDRSITEMLGLPATNITAPWNESINDGWGKAAKGIKDSLSNISGDIFVDWNVYPLTGDDDIPGWLVIADDRTEFYRLQQIGEKAERMVDKSKLLGVLAHEIRNPMQTFRGLLQLLKLQKDPADMSKYIDIGINEVDRVTRLLNDFMLIGKPLNGFSEPLDLKTFLENMMPLLNGEKKGTSIEIKTSFNVVPYVKIDPRQLTQVIMNLVRNAFEAVNQRGQVYISLHEFKKEWVEIIVRDTGLGLSASVKNKLFQPFCTTKKDGTGLGLAVSQTIIHNYGGEIFAENHPDGGACFSILLPKKADAYREPDKIDVLLVTIDEMLRIPIERVLSAENINGITANCKDTSLFMLSRYSPSIIIIESAILGPQDYEYIKNRFPTIKVLIVGEDDSCKGLKDVCFIPKPINYAKLISKIKSILCVIEQ